MGVAVSIFMVMVVQTFVGMLLSIISVVAIDGTGRRSLLVGRRLVITGSK
jgi:hypothetical protein